MASGRGHAVQQVVDRTQRHRLVVDRCRDGTQTVGLDAHEVSVLEQQQLVTAAVDGDAPRGPTTAGLRPGAQFRQYGRGRLLRVQGRPPCVPASPAVCASWCTPHTAEQPVQQRGRELHSQPTTAASWAKAITAGGVRATIHQGTAPRWSALG